jgi:hypothetical protein
MHYDVVSTCLLMLSIMLMIMNIASCCFEPPSVSDVPSSHCSCISSITQVCCWYLVLQFSRMKVLDAFKSGQHHLLVATDVAARGLDIKSIKTVINYDAAKDIDTHIHR